MFKGRDPDSNETEINAVQLRKQSEPRVSTLEVMQIDLSN
jgi:hypothetical protein